MAVLKLMDHQNDFVNFGLNNRMLGALAWHEVGLGKTVSALILARYVMAQLRAAGVRAPKILLMPPKSLIAQWKSEIMRFTPELIHDFVIVPYSQLSKGDKLHLYYDIRILIGDEQHFLKTPDTQRVSHFCNTLKSIATSQGQFQGGKIISLTGTPMLNHAGEIFTTWALLTAPNLWEAAERIRDPKRYEAWKKSFSKSVVKKWSEGRGKFKRDKYGSKAEGVDNEDRLNELLRPVVHFRRAEDCLDLPSKQRIPIDLGLPDDKLLQDADIEKPEAYMALLERLARAKTPHAIDWLKDFLEGSNDKIVVFSPYKFPLEEINKRFKGKFALITGEQTMKERDDNVRKFKEGSIRGLLMTFKAGGVGLNLQFAHISLYLGYPWTPADIIQAMGRTHRNGQLERTLHYFLTSGENDRNILFKVMGKEEAIKRVENLLLANKDFNGIDRYI